MQENPLRIIPSLACGDAVPISPPTNELRTIRSEDLFAGAHVVLIQHAEEQYRLLITRNNRLILQK